jgi:hypothetical protein
MKNTFDPLKTKRGTFRVALNLTALGERAWEVLQKSQELEFDMPRFETFQDGTGFIESWAVILEEHHRFDADPRLVVDARDEQLHELWQLCEPDAELKMFINTNLEACRIAA